MSKPNPVVHFEMGYEDRERMKKFYGGVFGWEMTQTGPEMGNYVVVHTSETSKDGMVKTPGTEKEAVPACTSASIKNSITCQVICTALAELAASLSKCNVLLSVIEAIILTCSVVLLVVKADFT